MREEIKKQILEDLDIPPIPQAAIQVQSLVEDPDTTARDLASVISSDPVLTAQLLKHANSDFYGFPRTIGTVPLAVVVLGFDAVRETALGISALSVVNAVFDQDLFDQEKFWSHSLAVGVGARIVAREWRITLPGEAFVAGLMHDLGRLILASNWAENYSEVFRRIMSEERDACSVEKEELETDHAEVAGWLIERWNLPERLHESVAQHHHADETITLDLARCVVIADWLAHRAGFRHGDNAPYPPEPSLLTQALPGFDEKAVREKMHEGFRQAKGLLEMIKARV